jgi:hypothetical protein
MAAAEGTESDPTASSFPSASQEAASAAAGPQDSLAEPSQMELVESLSADRLWLLRQLDGGAWPAWRLDLAALERELGELLDRLSEASGRQP